MFSKLNSDNNVRKKLIEIMLEDNYIDYSNNSNTTSKLDGKLTKYCDNNYIGDRVIKSHYKNKITNDNNNHNIINELSQYDNIILLLTTISKYINNRSVTLKHEIYFNLGKLHELLSEPYRLKINITKNLLDKDNWGEAYTIIEKLLKKLPTLLKV